MCRILSRRRCHCGCHRQQHVQQKHCQCRWYTGYRLQLVMDFLVLRCRRTPSTGAEVHLDCMAAACPRSKLSGQTPVRLRMKTLRLRQMRLVHHHHLHLLALQTSKQAHQLMLSELFSWLALLTSTTLALVMGVQPSRPRRSRRYEWDVHLSRREQMRLPTTAPLLMPGSWTPSSTMASQTAEGLVANSEMPILYRGSALMTERGERRRGSLALPPSRISISVRTKHKLPKRSMLLLRQGYIDQSPLAMDDLPNSASLTG